MWQSEAEGAEKEPSGKQGPKLHVAERGGRDREAFRHQQARSKAALTSRCTDNAKAAKEREREEGTLLGRSRNFT